MEHIQQLEYISLRAWQALETDIYDGWILRASMGYTRRANSVQPLDHQTMPVDKKIAYCETWYQQRHLPCVFRLTPALRPPDLDSRLHERGYISTAKTYVQIAPLAKGTYTMDPDFHFKTTLTPAWHAAWEKWNNVNPLNAEIARRMQLQNNMKDRCFAWMGEYALGLAIRENQHMGLFDIVVAPEYRDKGIGTRLVRSLMAWGADIGASYAYLQVATNNAVALHVYSKLGFNTHHPYWYRVPPELAS